MIDFSKLTQPYLIAEIGVNHNGDMQVAKKLIDATFACSWNCAKFQKRNPDRCVPDAQKGLPRDTPWGRMTYLEYRRRLEFGGSEYGLIDRYCAAKPVAWTASVWDLDSLEFLMGYDLPFLKVPSAVITDLELVREVAKSGLPVVLSTGMSSLDEIDRAVECVARHGRQLVLMHCNSSYPARLQDLNLSCIPRMRERYRCIVGYSGHEYGLDPTTIAVALGARVVERHVTLDRFMWGTDQLASVEPQGMDKLFKQVRSMDAMLGDGVKRIYESEIPIREKLRRRAEPPAGAAEGPAEAVHSGLIQLSRMTGD
jgi:N-acetylneuraminate synthase